MKQYIGHSEFRHDSPTSTGILVVNLGTPDAPDRKSVRRYLKQFLSDPRVVELPRWLWWLILHVVVLNVRPSRSAKAYRQIWGEEGSPLLAISNKQVKGLRSILRRRLGADIHVELGMRYGNPSIADGLARLHQAAPSNLLILPLYPQYSGSTVGSVFDAVSDCLKKWRWVPSVRFVSAYHDHPNYIGALANKIENFWQEHASRGHLMMSFHGVPKRYLLKGDPYYCQCHKSARLLAEKLDLDESQWSLVFQSRFGREEWLRPYCVEELERLPGSGIKQVDLVCPGFSADCLETLEEIAIQMRQLFLDSGGEQFNYIPCLNDDSEHLEMMATLLGQHGLIPPAEHRIQSPTEDTLVRAKSKGANF